MNKTIITILTLFFALVLVTSTSWGMGVEGFGGVSYNFFLDEELREDVGGGFGFFLGGKYEALEDLKVIGQYEMIRASGTDAEGDVYLNLHGLVGMVSYDIFSEEEFTLYMKGGPGYYFGSMGVIVEGFDLGFGLEPGLGLKVGGGAEYEVTPDVKILGDLSYRWFTTKLDIDNEELEMEEGNFSGLDISLGASYSF